MRVAAAVLALTLAAWAPAASAPPKPPASPVRQALLEAWNEIGNKLITMAEDFPEDRYDYRPVPEVRSFAEILLHVAASDRMLAELARGQKPGPENLPRSQYPTRAKVVEVLRDAVRQGAAVLEQTDDAGLMRTVPFFGRPTPLFAVALELIEHSGEHYGNLVTYYRLNHLVPPASRPRR